MVCVVVAVVILFRHRQQRKLGSPTAYSGFTMVHPQDRLDINIKELQMTVVPAQEAVYINDKSQLVNSHSYSARTINPSSYQSNNRSCVFNTPSMPKLKLGRLSMSLLLM